MLSNMFLDVDSHRFFMAMGTEGFEITYVMDFAECLIHAYPGELWLLIPLRPTSSRVKLGGGIDLHVQCDCHFRNLRVFPTWYLKTATETNSSSQPPQGHKPRQGRRGTICQGQKANSTDFKRTYWSQWPFVKVSMLREWSWIHVEFLNSLNIASPFWRNCRNCLRYSMIQNSFLNSQSVYLYMLNMVFSFIFVNRFLI